LGFGALAISLSGLFVYVLVCALMLFYYKSLPFSKLDIDITKKYIKIALPVLAFSIIATAIAFVDKVMLQFFSGAKEVGYYTAGQRIASFIRLIGVACAGLLFPLLSSYLANKKFSDIKEKINKYERFMYLFVMPLAIFVIVYNAIIIKVILGEQYASSSTVFSITTITAFILLIAQPHITILFSGGFFKQSTVLNLLVLIVLVAAEYFLISPVYFNFGAKGTALAMLISNLFLLVVFRITSYLKMPKLRLRTNYKYIAYGLINFLFFYFIYSYMGLQNRVFRILFPLIYFSLTYASLYIVKLIEKSDIDMLKSVIDIKMLGKYVKNELVSGATAYFD
jgi:O-antigen/teichoic acid export membrane protein